MNVSARSGSCLYSLSWVAYLSQKVTGMSKTHAWQNMITGRKTC